MVMCSLDHIGRQKQVRLFDSRGVVGNTAGQASSGTRRHPRQGFFGGDISEVLIYNGAVSDQELQEITDYLTHKYSLE